LRPAATAPRAAVPGTRSARPGWQISAPAARPEKNAHPAPRPGTEPAANTARCAGSRAPPAQNSKSRIAPAPPPPAARRPTRRHRPPSLRRAPCARGTALRPPAVRSPSGCLHPPRACTPTRAPRRSRSPSPPTPATSPSSGAAIPRSDPGSAPRIPRPARVRGPPAPSPDRAAAPPSALRHPGTTALLGSAASPPPPPAPRASPAAASRARPPSCARRPAGWRSGRAPPPSPPQSPHAAAASACPRPNRSCRARPRPARRPRPRARSRAPAARRTPPAAPATAPSWRSCKNCICCGRTAPPDTARAPRRLRQRRRAGRAVRGIPRARRLQAPVHGLDVGPPLGPQPLLERPQALLGVDRDAVHPGRASAQHPGELHPRLGCQGQAFGELRIAHPRAQIDERPPRRRRVLAEMLERLRLALRLLPAERRASFDELRVHRDLDLQHVHPVLLLAELGDARPHHLGLLARVREPLFIPPPPVIPHELEKERDVRRPALGPDALDESVLDVVHRLRLEPGVIEQHLDAIRPVRLQPPHRAVRQQIRQPPRLGVVVAALLVRQQQPRPLVPCLRRRQPVLGVQQDRAGMRRQRPAHRDLELLHHRRRRLFAAFLRQRLLQAAALVHRRRRDHSARVRHRIHALEFPRCDLHEAYFSVIAALGPRNPAPASARRAPSGT